MQGSPDTAGTDHEAYLLVLSAPERSALDGLTGRLAAWLAQRPAVELDRVAATLAARFGGGGPERRAVVARGDPVAVASELRTLDPRRVVSGTAGWKDGPEVVFLFPGDGSQYVGMGKDLYRYEPVFRRELERGRDALSALLDVDLLTLLYPPESSDRAQRQASEALAQANPGHAALLAFEVALARWWIDRGIEPKAVLGYSLGEYSAAVVAGVLSLADALGLVVERARLTETTAPGRMLAVALPAEQVQGLLGEGLSLAAINGPYRCVVSGPAEDVTGLAERLDRQGTEHRTLPVLHGYHSHLLDSIIDPYLRSIERVALRQPRIPFLSSVNGGWARPDEVRCPGHWIRQLRQTIRFGPAIETLRTGDRRCLLEVGPGTTLKRLVDEQLTPHGRERVIVPSCRHPKDPRSDRETVLWAMASLWIEGVTPDLRPVKSAALSVEVDLETAPRWELHPISVAETHGMESAVSRAWSELLGLSRTLPDDHFFRLGGDSLSASRLLARLRRELNVEISLPQFLRQPTLDRLEDLVREGTRGGSTGGGAAIPTLRPVPGSGESAPAIGQEALWLVEGLLGPSAAYNVPVVLELEGRLDGARLARSLHRIVARHEVLRTRFAPRSGRPVQVIDPPGALVLPSVDLEGLLHGDARVWREVVRQELGRPFDLEREPPFRALLVRRGPERHVLAVTFHHIATDGWSTHVFLRELGAFYRAAVEQTGAGLDPLPLQFADFAAWQRERLRGPFLDEGLSFWRKRLEGLTVLDLPTDRPRSPTPSLRGGRVDIALDRDLVGKLDALATEEGTTLFPVLLAAFQGLLARWCRQADVIVGTPVAGRDDADLEGLIGYFVNMLALRTRIDSEESFRLNLKRAAQTILDAFAYRSIPFERVVEALQPRRSAGRNPIYQVVLALQNRTAHPPELPGLSARLEELHPGVAKFDLALQLRRDHQRVEGYLEYATELFDRATAESIARSYLRLVEAVVRAPDRRLEDLSMLSPEEERELLLEQTGAPGATTAELAIPAHHLVARWAELAPDRVAVSDPGRALTYSGLQKRAQALAIRLRRAGITVESRVALALDRSPDLLVAALSVLQTGAAYLPLDPAYPAERLDFMIRDAGVRAVVTDRHRKLPVPAGTELLVLSGEAAEGLAIEEPLPAASGSGDHVAYVIYTSGSTGRPKGVQVTHRGLSNLIAWHRSTYSTRDGEHAALLASPGFDASVWESWPVLASGATLHVPPGETAADPTRLVQWLTETRITTTFLPTPVAEAALERPWPETAPLQTLLTGGDALRKRPGGEHPFRLVNHYGPTESSVVATAGPVAPARRRSDLRPPSIGAAISNLRVHVVDRCLRPVPRGMPGELVVSGVGLARGYLDRPGLTAERFPPDPSPEPVGGPGGRLYRTGDLARLRADGRLDFLGRIDRQIKIRGFRIEVGEVEAALTAHSDVAEAVVTARPSPLGDPLLAAYVVPAEGAEASPQVLRDALRRRLPAYMVPAALTILESLPLTPNGKLDRDALPGPEIAEADDEPLDGPVEEELGRIWSGLLDVEQVGAYGHFFALGGHSLIASRLAARIRQSFGVDLSLATVMETPVLADLAWEIEEQLMREMKADAEAATPRTALARGDDA